MDGESENLSQELEQLLDEHDFTLPEVGDIRKGIIVSISNQGVILDLGLKRDGIVLPADLENLTPEKRESLKLDEEIPVFVVHPNSDEGLIVSIHKAVLQEDWIRASELLESGEIIEGEIEGYNRGGLIVPFGGLRGFIPASHHIEINPGLNDRQRQRKMAKMKGLSYPVRVIEVDARRQRLVMSQRDAHKEWEEARKAELLERLNEGDIIPGRVSSLSSFGAFVDIGGADGLVHVSELAWHRVDDPKEVVSVGDEFDVYVLRLDPKGKRISLSRKKLLPNPWDSIEERYSVGQLVEGQITRIVNYGAFVEIEPGVEGLLHVSRLLRSADVENPREVVAQGEKHLLRIVSLNSDRQRIALSLKAVTTQEQIDWMTRQPVEDVPPEPAGEIADDAADAGASEMVADADVSAEAVAGASDADANDADANDADANDADANDSTVAAADGPSTSADDAADVSAEADNDAVGSAANDDGEPASAAESDESAGSTSEVDEELEKPDPADDEQDSQAV